jgi:integrase
VSRKEGPILRFWDVPSARETARVGDIRHLEFLQPYLVELARGRDPQAALFGEHWRDWPRKWVQRICKAAGGPKVTAHGMRGLHGTPAVDSGITSHAVGGAHRRADSFVIC